MWQMCSKNHEIIQFDVIGTHDGDCPLCRANELILDLFTQGCGGHVVEGGEQEVYHHDFISAYEDAQRYLLEIGAIKPDQCAVE